MTQLIKQVSAAYDSDGRAHRGINENCGHNYSTARGAVLAEGPYSEVSRNQAVMEAYMGTTEAELRERTHEHART